MHSLSSVRAVLLIAQPASMTQENIIRAQRLQQEAATAYQAGDSERFTTLTERALAANPASQATRYNLACEYARTGRQDEATAPLN
ncbi:MAG: hypothetical protein JSV80_03485 [Acidobacteriota bacterium]|nr:MAG: hypothetical protein JSV80_03485 [Acidobacteriota bacterium]